VTSSAGTIREVVNNLSDGETVTLAQLHLAVLEAGIQKTVEQVYADVQSLASRGQVGRANANRTYCKVVDQEPGRNDRRVHGDDTVAARTRAVRAKGGRQYSTEEVLQGLSEAIGDPVERSKTIDSYAFVLLGDYSPAFLLERAETVLGGVPSSYALGRSGPNTVVFFYA
jgi:hypothetical protein